MAKSWSEVSKSPEFQALNSQQKEEARTQYFFDEVAPHVPTDDLQTARDQFDQDTNPSLYQQIKSNVSGALVDKDLAAKTNAVITAPISDEEKQRAHDLGISLKRGTEEIPGMVTGLLDIPSALVWGTRPFTKIADAAGEATGFQPGQWAEEAAQDYSPEHQRQQQEIEKAWAEREGVTNADLVAGNKDAGSHNWGAIAKAYALNPEYIANQVVESAPSMVAGGVGSRALMLAGRGAEGAGTLERVVGEKMAAPIAGGIGEGSVQAGQQMSQYQGDDQRKNAIAAIGSGLIDAVIGAGAGRVAEHFGLETAETAMAKGFDSAVKNELSLGRRIAGGALSEGVLQELPQSAQEQVWQNYADGKPLWDGVERNAIEGALAGFVMGGAANIKGGGQDHLEISGGNKETDAEDDATAAAHQAQYETAQVRGLSDDELNNALATANAANATVPNSVDSTLLQSEAQRRANLGTLTSAQDAIARNQPEQGTLSTAVKDAGIPQGAVDASQIFGEEVPDTQGAINQEGGINAKSNDSSGVVANPTESKPDLSAASVGDNILHGLGNGSDSGTGTSIEQSNADGVNTNRGDALNVKDWGGIEQIFNQNTAKDLIEKYGIDKTTAEKLSTEKFPMARDSVTGLIEGRRRNEEGLDGREFATAEAEKHVAKHGGNAFWIQMDFANLGGLNEHFNNNNEFSDVHFKAISDTENKELNKIGAHRVDGVRTGGDEFGAAIVGGDDLTIEKIYNALDIGDRKIKAYADVNGFGDIIHPKHPEDASRRGVGIHYGVARIMPGDKPVDVYDRAIVELNNRKKGITNERPIETGIRDGSVQDSRPTTSNEITGAVSGKPREQGTRISEESGTQQPSFNEGEVVARVGITPKTAEPVTVRSGIIHIGEEPAIDFESGEEVKSTGNTLEAIKRDLTAAGSLSTRDKFFAVKPTVSKQTTTQEQSTAPEHSATGVDDRDEAANQAIRDLLPEGSTPSDTSQHNQNLIKAAKENGKLEIVHVGDKQEKSLSDFSKKFSGNKIFTADKVEAAQARLRAKLGTLNSGIDPELLIDGMTVAGAYVESGVREFSEYAKEMVSSFGDNIKPYLLSFYEAARAYPGTDTSGMSTQIEASIAYQKLITPEVKEAAKEVIGEGKVKAKKLPPKPDGQIQLVQDWGVSYIDGYTNDKNGNGTDADNGVRGGVKDQFLDQSKKYLNQVAKLLEAEGYEPYADKKGKPTKAVSVNESGVATSGEVSLTMHRGEVGIYVHVGVSSLRGLGTNHPQGVAIMARVTDKASSDRFATRGNNLWLPTNLNATSLANDLADRAARFNPVHKITAPVADQQSNSGLEVPQDIQDKLKAAKALPATSGINTAERIELRNKIAEDLYGDGAKVKQHRLDIVIGLPASGKSSAVAEPVAKENGSLIVDSDMAKERLPEYDNGIGAGRVHEESSAIAKTVLEKAIENGDNIVYPTVGKTYENLVNLITGARSNGYSVNINFVDLPVEKAFNRAISRYKSTGRLVNPQNILDVGLTPSTNFDKLQAEKLGDRYVKYSNDVAEGQKPTVLSDSGRRTGEHFDQASDRNVRKSGTQESAQEAGAEEVDNAKPISTEVLPARDQGSDNEVGANGSITSESVASGLAGKSQSADTEQRVPASVSEPTGTGTGRDSERDGQQPSDTNGNNSNVRSKSGTTSSVTDHTIEESDQLGKGGLGQKYRDNIAAIKIIKALEQEGRIATLEERKQLAKYSGWGALKSVFDKANKQWSKQHQELKELLTPEEWKSAQASVLNAFYTSPTIIKSIYQAIDRFGFKGGRLLEPSVGTGNFFGMMPADLRNNSKLHGVELDNLTSRLARALYPKAVIATSTGFQDYQVPNGYFDMAIGNPPFGSEAIVDKERNPYSGFSIHNYFIARMIDKTREGGIVPVIVSHSFMDAINPKAREWIAQRANLIGAVRLPDNAFKENAGTEVVTDVLFFQKTDKPEKNPSWVESSDINITNPKTGDSVTASVNSYFQKNKQNILGNETASGSMYRGDSYTVEGNGDLDKQLDTFIKSLPENIYQPVVRNEQELDTADNTIPDGVKQGSFYVTDSGQIKQRGNDVAGLKVSVAWNPKNEGEERRMRGMIQLRDLLRKQLRMERSNDFHEKEIESNRAALNKVYDSFVKTNGYVNSQINRRVFIDDTEAALVQALEFNYDPGVSKAKAESSGMEEKKPSAKKADILQRRVLFPPSEVLNVNNAQDAMLASLNIKGKFDIEYMQEVYGKSEKEIVDELGDLVFNDPDEGYVTSEEYLSGDVKTKLENAKTAAETDNAFKRNVEALEKVIPADKVPSEIHAALGAAWVPHDVFESFAQEITGGKVSVGYLGATAQWFADMESTGDIGKMQSEYGTDKMHSFEIFKNMMNGKPVEVKKKISDPSTSTGFRYVTDEEATEAARQRMDKIKSLWESWVWNDGERATRLAGIFNDKHNRHVPRSYDGSHLTLPGTSPVISLRPHQKNAIWRALQERNELLDHTVGAGKTFVMAAIGMEMKRLGIARKMIYAVPNHLTMQWRSGFSMLYPGANVLAATPEDFSKENRERMFSKIATGDYDAIVIGHSSVKKIGLDPEIEARMYKEQVQDIADAIEEMKRERGDKGIVRDMEKIKANLEAKVNELINKAGTRDKVVTFDELGIDGLIVDEMHEFKNLFFTTQKQRVSGLGNPKGSGKAFDLFMKVRWMQETLGEDAPFITATGTPVSNSLSEMYTMQRFMRFDELKREGLHLFDAWSRMYGEDEYVYEVAPSGVGYRISQRFSKFKNLPSLMGHYKRFADTVTLQDLKDQAAAQGKKFPVPKMKGGKQQNIVARRSDLQRDFFGVPQIRKDEQGKTVYVIDPNNATIEQNADGNWILRADNYSSTSKTKEEAELDLVEQSMTPILDLDPQSIVGQFSNLKELSRRTKGKINALSLTGLANKAGLDYRLIDPSAPDFEGSKINMAIDNMVNVYHEWMKDKGTQIIFCDLSVPLSARSQAASKEKRLYVLDDQRMLTHKKGTLHTVEGREGMPFYLVREGKGEKATVIIYEPVSGAAVRRGFSDKKAAQEWVKDFLETDTNRDKWFDARDRFEPITADRIAEYRDEHDLEVDEDGSNEISADDLEAVAGSSQFSVYDDIKQKLEARGIPSHQIAFIHDYNTPKQKADLFRRVNSGDVRFILGSTPKLGAGTNVQERLVGLHHIDAPWRPSDLEQREGRIIRQGNKLYERDPDGFEVFIGRYATEQTYDTRRWQLLEHKASGIEQLRKYSGEAEIEDVTSEASNSADMKAAASGNPLILEETQLRTEVKRLTALQRAHADGKYAMQAKLNHNRRMVDTYIPESIAQYDDLINESNKHPLPKDKDAISPTVVNGKRATSKENAEDLIGLLSTKVRDSGLSKDFKVINYRGIEFKFVTGFDSGSMYVESPTSQIIGYFGKTDKVSPSGIITRFNNYIENLPARKEDQIAKLRQAETDISSIEKHIDSPFEEAEALEKAKIKHAEIQRALMKSTQLDAVPPNERAAFIKELDDRRKMLNDLGYSKALKEADSGGTVFSRNAAQSKNAINREDLDTVAKSMRSTFKGLPPLHVHEDYEQAPPSLKRDITDSGATDVAGAWHNGEVHLFRNNIKDIRHAVFVSMHEATHHGLRNLLGDSLDPLLLNIYMTNPTVAKAANKIVTNDRTISRVRAVEEVLADMGGDMVPASIMDKLTALLRKLIRKAGFDLDYSDGEVRSLVSNALNNVKSPSKSHFNLSGTAYSNNARPQQNNKREGGLLDRTLQIAGGQLLADKITKPLYAKAAQLADRLTPEIFKAGVINDYGLDKQYTDRRDEIQTRMIKHMRQGKSLIENLQGLTREESRIAYQWLNEKPDTAAEASLMSQLPAESREYLNNIKSMIDDLSKQAVALGQLDAETYKKNQYAYLHRSYAKYVLDDKSIQGRRTAAKRVIGDQYKGRGLKFGVTPDRLLSPNEETKADKGQMYIRLERKTEDGKVTKRVWWNAAKPIPSEYSKFESDPQHWEVKGIVKGKVILWRDFTKAERERMGEIDEAKFAFATTISKMSHDIEIGKFFDFVAREYSQDEVPDDGEEITAHDIERGRFNLLDAKTMDKWIKVPDTKIQGTSVAKYGAIAGKYVPAPVWNDIRQIANPVQVWEWYDKLMSAWKLSKTALSPVVHTNNIMANFIMADMHDVQAHHVYDSLINLLAAKRPDLPVVKQIMQAKGITQESAQKLIQRYEDSGASGGMFMHAELKNEFLKPLMEQLQKEMTDIADETGQMVTIGNALSLMYQREWRAGINTLMASGVGSSKFSPVKWAKLLTKAYGGEDEIFRFASFIKNTNNGMEDIDAGKQARRSFVDYQINAPWIQNMRKTFWPFIAFTYRMIPMTIDTFVNKPWKLAKYYLVGTALIAITRALLGADDDDDLEKLLPEDKQGLSPFLTPRLIPLGKDEEGRSRYLDATRWIPLGDIFELQGDDANVMPIPPSLVPSGFGTVFVELLWNKSRYNGKEIWKRSDAEFAPDQAYQDAAEYTWKSLMPNMPLVPLSYSYDKLKNAAKGQTDIAGRQYDLGDAALSSVGIKVARYSPEALKSNAAFEFKDAQKEITQEMHSIARQAARHGLTDQEEKEAMQREQEKLKRAAQKYQDKVGSN